MKKLISFLAVCLMALSFFVFPRPQSLTVQAAPATTTWTRTNAFGTYSEVSTGYITISSVNKYIVWDIKQTTADMLPSIATFLDSGLYFYNSANTLVDSIKLIELAPLIQSELDMHGVWIFDLTAYAVPSTAVKMKFRFAQATQTTWSLTDMNAENLYDLNPTGYLLTARYYVGTTIYTNKIFYLKPDLTLIPTVPSDVMFDRWLLVDGTQAREENVYDSTSPYVVDGILYLYAGTVDLHTVNFMNGLVTYLTDIFTTYVDEPTPPTKTGYVFQGWYDKFNNPFLFDEIPTESMYNSTDGELYLYAKWSLVLPDGTLPGDTTPNAITALGDLLTKFGLYNFPGLMFLYFVTLVVVIGLLAYFVKPAPMIYTIVGLAITVIFMFMQLLPLYAAIIIIAFYIMAMLYSFKSGGQTA